MAFADTVFDGQAALDGVQGVRIDDPPEISRCLLARAAIRGRARPRQAP
jgi:hypothetical protein